MTLKELIELNSIVFGVGAPKIRIFESKYQFNFDRTKQSPENIFFYFGGNAQVEVAVNGTRDFVYIQNYTNLHDLLDHTNYNQNTGFLTFKLMHFPVTGIVAPNNTDIFYDYQNGYTIGTKDNDFPQSPHSPVVADITYGLLARKVSGSIVSSLRYYLLEYDQTKIMKL